MDKVKSRKIQIECNNHSFQYSQCTADLKLKKWHIEKRAAVIMGVLFQSRLSHSIIIFVLCISVARKLKRDFHLNIDDDVKKFSSFFCAALTSDITTSKEFHSKSSHLYRWTKLMMLLVPCIHTHT